MKEDEKANIILLIIRKEIIEALKALEGVKKKLQKLV